MRTVNQIVLASTNLDKLQEFQKLFAEFGDVEIRSVQGLVRNYEKLGCVETGLTYVENSGLKARVVNQGCHYPALGDDSGIEVVALEGRPGVHSQRFAIARSGESQDHANIHRLLQELRGVPMANRKAKMVCHLVLLIEGISLEAHGEITGTIAEAPSGGEGFGYDSIFIPDGKMETLSELGNEEKAKFSHRRKAVELLVGEIKRMGLSLAKP